MFIFMMLLTINVIIGMRLINKMIRNGIDDAYLVNFVDDKDLDWMNWACFFSIIISIACQIISTIVV